MGLAPFPIVPELMAIAIAYHNEKLIADQVLPRVPVGLDAFRYWKFPVGEGFTIPDTAVGRKGKPNEISFTATEEDSHTEDFALDDPIPQKDLDNCPPNYNMLGRSTEQLTNLIELDREVRTAGIVFNANNFGSANKTALQAGDKFSNTASDPIKIINGALDACIMRPNIMTIGRAAWTALRMHPKILKAVNHNLGDSGIASLEQVAILFELEQILVGSAWVNTAKKGQSVNLSRAWGPSAALIYRDSTADTRTGTTFGFTAQHGTRLAGSIPDPNIGYKGGARVRVGESVKELITAPDLGYLLAGAV